MEQLLERPRMFTVNTRAWFHANVSISQ